MLLDDLRAYGRGGETKDRQIRNKLQADMVYYIVLKEMLHDYGIEGSRDISTIHPDGLGAARDQMAMRASDQGVVRYTNENLVEGFRVQDENGRFVTSDRLSPNVIPGFVRASILNSEALQNMVMKHLVGESNADKLDDDAKAAMTEAEFGRILDAGNPDSVLSRVVRAVQGFDMVAGVSEDGRTFTDTDHDLYAYRAPDERLTVNDTRDGFRRDIGTAPGRSHDCLKISPLMPELRSLRLSGIPQAERLGLYAQPGQRIGRDGSMPENMNGVLQFDTQKSLLQVASQRYHGEYMARSVEDMFGNNGDLFIASTRASDDFVRGASYTRTQTVETVETRQGDDGRDEYTGRVTHVETRTEPVPAYDVRKVGADMKVQFGWQMAELMNKYSRRELEPEDLDIAFEMFNRQIGGTNYGATVFGDPQAQDPQSVIANAQNYFSYIEHVFSTVQDKMSSHEFEIHFAPQTYVERETGGYLPMLYITGEHTHDVNRAKSNPTRFFAFYPYLDYVPKNLSVQPVAGDIVSGSYDPYSITNRTFRASDEASQNGVNRPSTNKYTQMHMIDRAMVAGMRETFDAWADPGKMSGRDISIVKMARSVGNTGAADLSEFLIPNQGAVDASKVIRALAEDMETSKAVAKAGFLRPENRERMASILDAFISEQCDGAVKPDGSDFTFGDAVYLMAARMRSGATVDDLRHRMSSRLESLAARELNTSYGADVTGYTTARHVYHAYLGSLVRSVTDGLARDIGTVGNGEAVLTQEVLDSCETLDSGPSTRMVDEMLDGVSDPDSPILSRALDQVFGYTDPGTGNLVLKANMCRHASSGIMPDDYDSLLRLLSYTDRVNYVSNPGAAIRTNLQGHSPITVQLYASEAFGVDSFVTARHRTNGVSEAGVEDGDTVSLNETMDDDDADASEFNSTRDEKAWFDATFAPMAPGSDRTFTWMTESGISADGTIHTDDYNVVDRAVWRATHPLQLAAMTRVDAFLREHESDTYSPDRLFMTSQGMLYYLDANNTPTLKLGPFTEKKAWIRPVVTEVDEGTYGARQVDLPAMDEAGVIRRNEAGNVVTRQAWVTVDDEIRIGRNGELLNPVAFGPLDTQSATPGTASDAIVMNRYYGISGKVRNYDGYNHNEQSMPERVKLYTYQMAVLDNLDRCLGVYEGTHRATGSKPELMRSVFFANVSASSLAKCYRSNTYILEDKAKSMVANQYLGNFVHNPMVPRSGTYARTHIDPRPEAEEATRRVANLVYTQSQMFNNRVVLPRVDIDENVGLYGIMLNLDQMSVANTAGNQSRKNMRLSDCKGSRVGLQSENPVFDSILTGSARNMGAVAFLSDGVQFDPITGRLTTLRGTGDEASAILVSAGVMDFETGGVDSWFMPHKGGQAVDRAQLSTNGGEKSLMYSPATFAMVNLGYNMEDGYIVAKRSAGKFGHFDENGVFQPLQKWDKIGDTESGNKGIVSKIVNTDITDENEFRTEFAYEYFKTYAFNHGKSHDGALREPTDAALEDLVSTWAGYDGQHWESALMAYQCADGMTVGDKIGQLREIELGTKNRNGFVAGDPDEIKQELHDALCSPYGPMDMISMHLDGYGVEPFAGAYRVERDIWKVFRDNPDLDLAMTNVCVCTRSNPSILMSVQDQAESGGGVLWVENDDGTRTAIPGAKGVFNVYTDSHTADDKNKDYNEVTFKQGRALAAQEMYAVQAKHASGLLSYMTANDSTLPDRIMKYERKILMNGYYADPNAQEDSDGTGFVVRRVSDVLPPFDPEHPENGAQLSHTPEAGAYTCDAMPGIRFVDLDGMADTVVKCLGGTRPNGTDMKEAVEALGQGDFSKLFALGAGTKAGKTSPQESEDAVRRMFTASVGRYGGAYVLLPESLDAINANVDIGLKCRTENGEEAKLVNLKGYAAADGKKRALAPLFMSAREIPDQDTGLSVSPIDNRKQFQIFRDILAGAVIEKLAAKSDHGQAYVDPGVCRAASGELLKDISSTYASCPEQKSMSLNDMNGWLKKNLYRTVTPNSLTCVWNGNPTLEIDEAGLSFEKAKSLGILKPKAGLSKDELSQIPDTYEFMSERYEPLTDDDFILVNRSPGQTTGCIRALRVKITSASGDGLEINPACATIFDGDFDGDTVGVSYPAAPVGLKGDPEKYEALWPAAKQEIKTRLTMQGNMCHKADYTELTAPDGTVIPDVHPLFIAKNADYAVAMYNMKQKDVEGRPACGYDIGREMDRTTAMANMLEHLRQCAYDAENVVSGKISEAAGNRIIAARMEQISDLRKMFDGVEHAKLYAGDDKFARNDHVLDAGWNGILRKFDDVCGGASGSTLVEAMSSLDMDAISKLDRETFAHMSAAYRDMPAYMTKPSLMTHGTCACETLYHIISDANISKKGKEPQLNALLKFAGVHEACGGHLSVVKNSDGKFEMLYDGQPSVPGKYEPENGVFDTEIRMDHMKARSDVAPSRFFTQSESNLVAQGCKSDGTGLGGAAAQKLQKIMAPLGYGETALRISGPITQNFLDAKQNVQRCAINMNIGKSILNTIVGFGCVDEFADSDVKKKNPASMYGGQFTIDAGRSLTVPECAKQMHNFLVAIGQPGFSKVDYAVMDAVMERYATDGKNGPTVKNPVREADRKYDMTYAAMYGSDFGYASLLDTMADEKRGIYSRSVYDGQIDGQYVTAKMLERTVTDLEKNTQVAHAEEYIQDMRQAIDELAHKPQQVSRAGRGSVRVQDVEQTVTSTEADGRAEAAQEAKRRQFASLFKRPDKPDDDKPDDKKPPECPVD